MYSTDGTESPILVETDGDAHNDKPRIKYGELVILGWVFYNYSII